jgi:hypothetical protein
VACVNGTTILRGSPTCILPTSNALTHGPTCRSTTSPKVKTTEGKRVRACSLTHNISRVEGHVGVPRWGLGQMTSKSIIHMDLHKPNNKLVSA